MGDSSLTPWPASAEVLLSWSRNSPFPALPSREVERITPRGEKQDSPILCLTLSSPKFHFHMGPRIRKLKTLWKGNDPPWEVLGFHFPPYTPGAPSFRHPAVLVLLAREFSPGTLRPLNFLVIHPNRLSAPVSISTTQKSC